MARLNSLDPTRRKLNRLSDFIRRRMRELKLKQSDMAADLFITQQAFSIKLNQGTFTTEQLLRIFERLKATKEEAGDLMI